MCKPPTTFAPYFVNNRAEQPAPSPLNNPIVATQSTIFPFQRSEWSLIKFLTMTGAFENCTGYAKTIKSCCANKFAVSFPSIGIARADSSNNPINFSIQCLVFPVPLKYMPIILFPRKYLFVPRHIPLFEHNNFRISSIAAILGYHEVLLVSNDSITPITAFLM